MYLWNAKALAKELKEGTLSEKEKFKYYFLTVILYAVASQVFSYLSFARNNLTPIDLFFSIIWISVPIIGTYFCYEANKQGDGINFIERFICLNIPVSIKLTVIFILLLTIGTLVIGIITALFFRDISRDSLSYFISSATLYIVDIAIYYKLYKYLKLASGADSGNN